MSWYNAEKLWLFVSHRRIGALSRSHQKFPVGGFIFEKRPNRTCPSSGPTFQQRKAGKGLISAYQPRGFLRNFEIAPAGRANSLPSLKTLFAPSLACQPASANPCFGQQANAALAPVTSSCVVRLSARPHWLCKATSDRMMRTQNDELRPTESEPPVVFCASDNRLCISHRPVHCSHVLCRTLDHRK